jgi:hypothetical protein
MLGDGATQAADDLGGVARGAVEPGDLEVGAAIVGVAVFAALEADATE